ncbi:DUF4149 domain-containing protein [Hydrogenivirga caldilitoris]|nr:DUF4149 domain-containing protein [Hydrogenivirga caldilitoris]
MNRIMIFMLSFYFGLGAFFSYIVAPELFRSLERSVAGGIVEKVFPIYFGIGLGAVGLSLLIGLASKMDRFLIALLAVNLIVLLALQFYVLPEAHALKSTGSPEFARAHLISMIMSTVSLFFTFGAIVYLIVKTKNGSS